MKTTQIYRRVSLFVCTCLMLIQMAPGLVAGQSDHGANHGGVQVVFTKWVTDWPNMAGLVSGDIRGGTFAGEILEFVPAEAINRIEALYHLNGGRHQMTARVSVTQNNVTGVARIEGVVTDGHLKGMPVRGQYQVIAPCGVINAQNGAAGDRCFQGTLDIGPHSSH